MPVKFFSFIHRPHIMLPVIVIAFAFSVEKYGLPAIGGLLYEWNRCASDAELAYNYKIEVKKDELLRVVLSQRELFFRSFQIGEYDTFSNKETIYAQHKKMMKLRIELAELLRGKDPDEWNVPYSQIEEMIDKYIAGNAIEQQLFEDAVNSINEDVGKSFEELNSSMKHHNFYWQDYMHHYVGLTGPSPQQEYELPTLYTLYKKKDCRESEHY